LAPPGIDATSEEANEMNEMNEDESASAINVLVVATSPDMKAEGIAAAVEARSDMDLVGHRVLTVAETDVRLQSLPLPLPCAVVIVGPPATTEDLAERWLAARADLVVMHVELVADLVRIAGVALRDPSLPSLLSALRELVERVSTQPQQRVSRVRLRSIGAPANVSAEASDRAVAQRPLLNAAIEWAHTLLRDAVENVPDHNGDVHGLSVTRTTLLQSLDAPAERVASALPQELAESSATLDRALSAADAATEPLAAAARVFDLEPLEFRLVVLALTPELDHRYQRCAGFLLDELGRRVGTLGLYAALLGAPARVRGELARAGALARWRVFEGQPGRAWVADEPLRLDPFLAEWLLGDPNALDADPRVRRAMRLVPWPGAALLTADVERASAASLLGKLQASSDTRWVLLGGDDPAGWRALVELGATAANVEPIRVSTAHLAGVDLIEIEECARRVGRLTRLTGAPLVVDVARREGPDADDEGIRLFLVTLGRTACRAALICDDEARVVSLLGGAPYERMDETALPMAARVAAVRTAATGAGAYLTQASAEAIARQYPLHVDGFEHAMHLAQGRPLNYDADDPRLARFIAACQQAAGEGVSHLAERIEPVFTLDDVVLPPDRKQQLIEVVDNVRLAAHVLDEWKFSRKLPYGRGVSALFFGPSGTGKTMAAMGVARALGIQLLRIDLSRVVSKYIGDTEKNLDRVFSDAQRSGSAILIDEADALFGKRSEVKDSHDRYANIEVAYLLQRMEAYQGLAILTTNLRQNLDPAFVRRLRFIVDFPRPDAEAREKIWRHCLPAACHALDDGAFRQLARRIDLTGGHICQITVRAAFIAAAADTRIGLEHVAQAARAELAKLGMPPVELDLVAKRRAA
jgi:AAA+ superfamily predicted ATPase